MYDFNSSNNNFYAIYLQFLFWLIDQSQNVE